MERARNYSLDVYRMFLAFGIVLLHVCETVGFDRIASLMHFCVPAFAIITGYFGAGFKISKVVRLYATAGACLLIIWFMRAWAVVPYAMPCLDHWWFLHAYVIMIVLSPFVDELFNRANDVGDKKRILAVVIPFMLVVFGWGWIVSYKLTQQFLPTANGLGNFSFLNLLGAYVVGRVIRFFDLEQRLPKKIVILLAVISFLLGSFSKYWRYNDPLCVVLAASTFLLFIRLRTPNVTGSIAAKFAPSMFAVYLLHLVMPIPGNGEPRALISYCWRIVPAGDGMGQLLVVSVLVFMAAIMLDLPRRIVLAVFGNKLKFVCKWIDESFNALLGMILVKEMKDEGSNPFDLR